MLRNRTFSTFLIVLPIMVLVGFLKPLPIDQLQRNRNIENRFWMAKTHYRPAYDVVMMGDSRMYRGLSPWVMSCVLPGWRILNFGYSYGGLNSVMFRAAEAKLDPASKKKTIILGVTPLSLTPSALKNEHYNETKYNDYIFTSIFPPQLEDFFAPILVSYLFREKKLPDRLYRQVFHGDGWVASWTVPEDTQEALVSYREVFKNNRVSLDIVRGVMEQTSDWVSRDIMVYAFCPPTSPAMKTIEDAMSGFDEASFIRQFEKAGGKWLAVPDKPYHSYDGSHLDKDSAVKLSAYLADSIRRNVMDYRRMK
jgi:hypothetical protein